MPDLRRAPQRPLRPRPTGGAGPTPLARMSDRLTRVFPTLRASAKDHMAVASRLSSIKRELSALRKAALSRRKPFQAVPRRHPIWGLPRPSEKKSLPLVPTLRLSHR